LLSAKGIEGMSPGRDVLVLVAWMPAATSVEHVERKLWFCEF
jgi:hypothetical protein